jgi:PPOX class probable F420-dependent enzyme
VKIHAAECRRRFSAQQVARLATSGPDGPHVVPIVFALESDTIVFAVDHKPKTTRRLKRLSNLEHDSRCTVLVDHYDDDWSQLWWVRADAIGTISDEPADIEWAARLLARRYEQYVAVPPQGPVVRLQVQRWSGWAARPLDHSA